MKDCIEIVGPCSKWVQDKGWVTQIPVHLIENAGFVSTDKLMERLKEEEKKRKSEKEKAFWQGRTVGKKQDGKSSVMMIIDEIHTTDKGITVKGHKP